jgi:hypothetical protein
MIMNEVPIQISKEVLNGLNPKGSYLVQAQEGGCSVHIYNSILAKRKDMHPLDISTGRPKVIRVHHGDIVTESIDLKDKTFDVDPSLKAVLDEIAEDYELIQSRVRVLEEANTALLQCEVDLNNRIEELEEDKTRLIEENKELIGKSKKVSIAQDDDQSDTPAKYIIKPTIPAGWYDVVENNAGEAIMNTKKLREKEALELIRTLESE